MHIITGGYSAQGRHSMTAFFCGRAVSEGETGFPGARPPGFAVPTHGRARGLRRRRRAPARGVSTARKRTSSASQAVIFVPARVPIPSGAAVATRGRTNGKLDCRGIRPAVDSLDELGRRLSQRRSMGVTGNDAPHHAPRTCCFWIAPARWAVADDPSCSARDRLQRVTMAGGGLRDRNPASGASGVVCRPHAPLAGCCTADGCRGWIASTRASASGFTPARARKSAFSHCGVRTLRAEGKLSGFNTPLSVCQSSRLRDG